MKKIISMILLFLVFVNPLTISFADSKIKIEKAKNIANEYIKNSFQDENWKDKNPKIEGNGVYNYVDNEEPSYIEFKVSCDKNPDCGFIIVNIDGNDVGVPIASTIGATPSEALTQKGQEKNTKMYYFGPFEQYSENTNGEVYSINPTDYDNSLNSDKKLSDQERNSKLNFQKENIKNKLESSKIEVKKFKKSEEFKKRKEEIKKLKDSIPESEFAIKLLPMSYADTEVPGTTGYTPPSASNVSLPGGISSTTCNGATPCYSQFKSNYEGTNGQNCWSGCVPTAVAILYGYYDRQNIAPNLIPGTAGLTNDYNTNVLVNTLRNLMGTYCDSNREGATTPSNIPLAIKYAKDKGYLNSTAYYSGNKTSSEIFSKVKSEINAGRPILLGNGSHRIVAFGYNSNVNNIVRVNLGWGGTSYITGNNGVNYKTSNIDYNINAIYYNGANQNSISNYVTFNISN